MVTAEKDQNGTHGGRHEQQPVLGEHVVLEATGTIPSANAVLFLLVVAVEGREVDIGRGFVDRDILVIRAEDRVDDNRRKREEEGRETSWMRNLLLKQVSLCY